VRAESEAEVEVGGVEVEVEVEVVEVGVGVVEVGVEVENAYSCTSFMRPTQPNIPLSTSGIEKSSLRFLKVPLGRYWETKSGWPEMRV
jgi:hypothetical protein